MGLDFTGISEIAPQDGNSAHAHWVPECKNMNKSPKAVNILPSETSLLRQPDTHTGTYIHT